MSESSYVVTVYISVLNELLTLIYFQRELYSHLKYLAILCGMQRAKLSVGTNLLLQNLSFQLIIAKNHSKH